MDQAWTSKPEAERVLALATDSRPAWLWSGDGARLLWQNHAATLFGAKIKNGALRRADSPTPVKGQISRILRLGLLARPMLSRMQFIAGRKPLSATCICTPLALGEDKPSLLVVGADAIDPEVLELAPYQPESPVAQDVATPDAQIEPEAQTEEAETSEPEIADVSPQTLAALVDKLAGDERLFAPLTDDEQSTNEDESEDEEAEDAPSPEPAEESLSETPESETSEVEPDDNAPERESDWDHADPFEREESAFVEDTSADLDTPRNGLWQLTGRGLRVEPVAQPTADEAQADANMEQVSRYNFEELARILHDRVGSEGEGEANEQQVEPVARTPQPSNLVSLSDETLVLNKLPLGILIFRDQDILFANRALVDLTGYGSAATLRAVGLSSVIPVTDGSEPAGPVSQLLRRDGTRIAVAARLHTVSWQGRTAVMLSARAVDGDVGREDEIRRFAADFATLSGSGYIEADKTGLITATSGAVEMLPANAKPGALISQIVAHEDGAALTRFLALPARFAETERPSISLRGRLPSTVVKIFALGRAGVISGYSAIFERLAPAPEMPGALSAASLARIGRELRRPLNTIVGFSELMVSESFGPLANQRYLEYARDINNAGAVITDLADELDDYVRLAEGKFDLAPNDIDLASMLADCLVRVRGQAGTERVLLRSAISERLPKVRADAATLQQAILNMLASAINEGGEGSKVVLSAQQEDDGAVTIHVRDAARKPGTLAEQFVVYRDGQSRDGTLRQPVRSSIGLTLTRTLVAVNACSLRLDPASDNGTLMTLTIPVSLIVL